MDVDKRQPGVLCIGWARGTQLAAPPHLLSDFGADGKPLKMIRVTPLLHTDQLDDPELIALLHQAAQLNEVVPISQLWGKGRRKWRG